ncbi:MAG TPA: GAF domain-containing protein, partial [Ktedonobacteraceae bacterium]|nr:GAF domain-containing protein [Ktedonobacteraceae bacterium]
MKPFNLPQDQPVDTGTTDVALLEQRCNVLNYITEIGTSLRLYMDTNALVQRISQAVCNALNFRHVALYLYNEGNYTVYATSGVGIEEEDYLRQHPLPEPIMTQLMHPDYRINNSYFIPAEASIWHDEQINNLFVVVEEPGKAEPIEIQPTTSDSAWQSEDLMIVPLFKSDGSLLGFLTPDSPLDDQRPTEETIGLFELFANQAAVAIEGTLLYEEVRRSSEERAVLVEIARALSLPEALRDVETVYRTIYQQVCRIMPVDVFYLTRYQSGQRVVLIDYRVEDGEECSTGEQHELPIEAMQRFEGPEQDL